MTPAQYHAEKDAHQKRAMADRIRIAESFIVDLRDELHDMDADDETIRMVNIAMNTLENIAVGLEQPYSELLEQYKKEDAAHDQHLLDEESQAEHETDVNINRYAGCP